MLTKTSTDTREVGEARSLPIQVLAMLRRSFLLSFATFGLVLLVLGATVFSYFDYGALAGLSGAAGIIIFLSNVAGYGIYKYFEQRY